MFYDASYNMTSYVVFEESAVTTAVNSSDSLNGSFHLEKLANGNLAMYAMGELWITDSNGNTVYSEYFEDTSNNQALISLEDSFIISTRDYLKKYNASGSLIDELKYGGQYLPEILRDGDSLFFVAGYENGEQIKTFYGSTDLELNLISLEEQP
jgi:hypothetical protein